MNIRLQSGESISVTVLRSQENINLFNSLGYEDNQSASDFKYLTFNPNSKRMFSFINIPKKRFIVLSHSELQEILLLGSSESIILYIGGLSEDRIFSKGTHTREA